MNDGNFVNLIKTVRFPLICLVVFSHSLGFVHETVNWMDFSSVNIYNFISQLISHNIAKIAVCTFFFFSGYLFFRNMAPSFWTCCLKKWKNRIFTLLIPFVSWNLISILAIILKNLIFSLFGHYCEQEMDIVFGWQVLEWFKLPADFPLWYIEDLMFMVLVSPIIYYAISKLRSLALLLLVIVYVLPFEPDYVNMRAIFFFSLGAYCSITEADVLTLCRTVKIPCYLIAAITLLIAVFYNSSQYHEWIIRFFYPFGIITFLNVSDIVSTRNKKVESRMQSMASSVFFIYAFHEIYILGWSKGLCLRLFGQSVAAMYLSYFLVPVITVAVCYLLFLAIRRIMPKTLSFICGGR